MYIDNNKPLLYFDIGKGNINMLQVKIFVLSIIYIGIYALHRTLFNPSYFGFSEIVYGYKHSISIKAILYKLIIPFLFTCIVYYITKSTEITFGSIFWGSILIVAPPFLNPVCGDERLYNKRKFLYVIYIVFILLNCLMCKFALKLGKFLYPLIVGYFKQFENTQQVFNHLIDIFVLPLAIAIIIFLIKPIFNLLNKEINNPNAIDEE